MKPNTTDEIEKQLWDIQNRLQELLDEYQPPEPYWTPIRELHTVICRALTLWDKAKRE